MSKKESIQSALKKYLPTGFETMVADLILSEPLRFKISKPRKTKLGDYRAPFNGKPHQITVNGNLNPYSFLITTLHEFAHMHTYIKFGNKVAPHGNEWKIAFKELLTPLLTSDEIPDDLKKVLNKSAHSISAATGTDLTLARVLKRYDKTQENIVLLEELGNDKTFRLGSQFFQRGILRRKRYLCKETTTGKMYLINRLAEVEPIEK
jgi:hypothetical protein